MSNFISRTITGVIFVIVLAGSVILSPYAAGTLFLILAVMAYYEFLQMQNAPRSVAGYLSGIIIYLLIFYTGRSILSPVYLLTILPVLSILLLFSSKEKPRFTSFWGIVYTFLPFALIILLTNPTLQKNGFEPFILLGFFVLVWINDVFAYLTGRLLGKHKLWERVSPKKTWEGALGGLLFTVAAAYFAGGWVTLPGKADWTVIAILVVVSGIAGDLFESALKRKAGIKDSGNILPGHGGVLDRFDAMLFSGPVVIFYVLLGLL